MIFLGVSYIYKINIFFEMVPRQKRYKNIINLSLREIRFKFNSETSSQFLFITTNKIIS